MFSNFFPKILSFMRKYRKWGGAREVAHARWRRVACRISKATRAQAHASAHAPPHPLPPTHTQICNIYSFSTAKTVSRTHFNVTFIQGGSNMTGTNCDLFTHNQSRSYLNHLVHTLPVFWNITNARCPPSNFSTILLKARKFLPNDTASHPVTVETSYFSSVHLFSLWTSYSRTRRHET